MADGDAGRCEPYRVEWRRFLTTGWMRMGDRAALGEATEWATRVLELHEGQVRVVEQRVVLVRGLGQDGGPDQAFIDWQKTPETRHGEFLREHERRIGRVDEAVARLRELTASVRERNERIHGASSGPEESELRPWRDGSCDCMNPFLITPMDRPDGGRGCGYCGGWLSTARSVVSDPDDRRDVEAAADAGQPMAPRCTCANLDLAPCPAHGPKGVPSDTFRVDMPSTDERLARHQLEAIVKARGGVTDLAGCSHRMSSGAVSLTACGECGAAPGDACAEPLGWRVEQARAQGTNVTHPPPGADRPRWHAWLDGLGVPRHSEPEQQTDTPEPWTREDFMAIPGVLTIAEHPTPGGPSVSLGVEQGRRASVLAHLQRHAPKGLGVLIYERQPPATAPASCTERMAPPLVVVTDGHGLAHGEPDSDGEPPGMAHACPECNAEPGEPCADPLEDRTAWAVDHGRMTRKTATIYTQPAAADIRSARHDVLDNRAVPRHLPRTPADTVPTTDGVVRAANARVVMVGPPDRHGQQADMTKPLGPDPWWRRLLRALQR